MDVGSRDLSCDAGPGSGSGSPSQHQKDHVAINPKASVKDFLSRVVDASPTAEVGAAKIVADNLHQLPSPERHTTLAGLSQQMTKINSISGHVKKHDAKAHRNARRLAKITYLDNTWGGRHLWAPAAHFPEDTDKLSHNTVGPLHSITKLAIQHGVDLASLWSPGGCLYESAISGGKTRALSKAKATKALALFKSHYINFAPARDDSVMSVDYQESPAPKRLPPSPDPEPPGVPPPEMSRGILPLGSHHRREYDSCLVQEASGCYETGFSDVATSVPPDHGSLILPRPTTPSPFVSVDDPFRPGEASLLSVDDAGPLPADDTFRLNLRHSLPKSLSPTLVHDTCQPEDHSHDKLGLVPSSVFELARQQLMDSRARLTSDVLQLLIAHLGRTSDRASGVKIADPLYYQVDNSQREGRLPCGFTRMVAGNPVIYFPLHHSVSGDHWSLAVLRPALGCLDHYDSLASRSRTKRVGDSFRAALKIDLTVNQIECPQQTDAVNCGVFAVLFLSSLLRNEPIDSVDINSARTMLISWIDATQAAQRGNTISPPAVSSPILSRGLPSSSSLEFRNASELTSANDSWISKQIFPAIHGQINKLHHQRDHLVIRLDSAVHRRSLLSSMPIALNEACFLTDAAVPFGEPGSFWRSTAEQTQWKEYVDSVQSAINVGGRTFGAGDDPAALHAEIAELEVELVRLNRESSKMEAVQKLEEANEAVKKAFGV
ncbi:hypothetical protein ACHAPJ_009642 [Fusarium lateritium]